MRSGRFHQAAFVPAVVSVEGVSTPFEISDRLVVDLTRINPVWATYLGVPGAHHSWGEAFSLAGIEAAADLFRACQSRLEAHLDHPDPNERLAARSVSGWLEEQLERFEAGDHFGELRYLGSPLHTLRSVFPLMPTATDDDREAVLLRLETVPAAFADMEEMFRAGVGQGFVVARRQVEAVAEQARHLAGDDSAFQDVISKVADGVDHGRLDRAMAIAKEASSRFSDWLLDDYLPYAVEADGVGPEVYRRLAGHQVGLDVDPHQAYEWGWEELDRLIEEMEGVGQRIVPGASWQEVRQYLDNDPGGQAASPEELLEFAREVLEQAVDDLAGVHFDVPEEIRELTVQIAPPGGALGVYYVAPSEDLSRPGGVWYAIGDQEVFPLYQHRSTAYHEGFPGHHLQLATASMLADRLSRAQRLLVRCTGYIEGWGMYAEVLMGELGYLEDPAQYFGMLAKQMYRAARVVTDIGLHLELPIPEVSAVAGGQRWGFGQAVAFMEHYGMQSPSEAEAEVLRYLGWPGQAICYKLGEREILSIREETRARLGDAFDMRDFHSTVLATGSVRLDLLREIVRQAL